MKKLLIIEPRISHKAYTEAANEFAALCEKVTGDKPDIVSDCVDFTDIPSDVITIVIGADDVNRFSAKLLEGRKLTGFPIRYGTDDYCVLSIDKSVIFAGGRGRSTIYSVYRYFEKAVGCRWFWDGDRIPQCQNIPTDDINIIESTRYEYRGTRYFAHRSLHRFQAEHWDFEDWKKEINWLLKKRLNMFMLRIGLDDIFQKAFPDIVDYPSATEKLPEAGEGFDDRTLFWSLEYRGELRKKILQYARDHDLMHPEDCGTMTHWYSRTPIQFLQKTNPTLLSQAKNSNYNQKTGLVWDIHDDKNLENYFRLTDTHIREYGEGKLFHTIGLAERSYSDDREDNLRLKLYVYRRIERNIRERYPNAKLFIASWDMWMFYTPEEAKRLIRELDPEQCILLDYTSETVNESNFTKWGVINNFPWIFGIFHAYEPSNEIRGNYDLIEERMSYARDDKMCKGIIFWPELSHGDTFMTEYFASNAWSPLEYTFEERLKLFCSDRYDRSITQKMFYAWKAAIQVGKQLSWSRFAGDPAVWAQSDSIFKAPYCHDFDGKIPVKCDEFLLPMKNAKEETVSALRSLLNLPFDNDEMTVRDKFDLARVMIARYADAGLIAAEKGYSLVKKDRLDSSVVKKMMSQTLSLLEKLTSLLSLHDDFSMYATLEKLKSVTEVNPIFASTLKRNSDHTYCRSYIAECARELYIPEVKVLFECVEKALDDSSVTSQPSDWDEMINFCKENQRKFENTPLEEYFSTETFDSVVKESAGIIESMSFDEILT